MMIFALVVLDVLLASFVIAPLVVLFWWTIWEIFQRFTYIFLPWWQLGISMGFLIIIAMTTDTISNLSHKNWIYAVFRRMYIYVCGIIGISLWRSEWVLMDKGFNFETSFVCMCIGVIFFIILKGVMNLSSSPMGIFLDHDPKSVYQFPTTFKTGAFIRRGEDWIIALRVCLRMRGSTAGISDGLKGSSHLHYVFLTILDHVISALVISPFVVSYWRGTWEFMSYFVYPDAIQYSCGVSLIIGYVGTMLFTLTQKYHGKLIRPDTHWLSYYLTSRLYTACFGLICVNSWRGAWMALDIYTTVDTQTVTSITLGSIVFLTVSRTLRNISASPFTIVTDRYEGYFDVPTLMKATTDNIWTYLFDCTFSVCVVGTLVVFVWRGAWVLLDMLLYPGQPALSAWASLGIGYILVFITFALQPVMKYFAKILTGAVRIVVVDIYLLFSFCGTINVWRGIWCLLNVYFLPDLPHLSCFLTHLLSFVALVLINSSNSILVRGVYVDGQENGEQCVDFPCYYIRLFFQARQKKKFLNQVEQKQKERRRSEAAESLMQIGPGKTPIIVSNHSEISNIV